MLYKLNFNIFIVGAVTIGFIAAMTPDRALNVMSITTVVAFITQMLLLLYFSSEDVKDFSERTLYNTTVVYSFLLGIVFMLISDYYEGDTFLHSKADAMYYFKQSIKVQELGLGGNLSRILQEVDYDDWAAAMLDTFAMYIIPDKLFLNFIYTLLGGVSAVFLYRIGKYYMPEQYAFVAVLAYSCSSYMVFFNCSFLKESWFVFFVISTIYNQHRAAKEKSTKALVLSAICVVVVFFFRPAVAAFLAAGIFVYYGIDQRGRAISLFLYMAALVVFLASLKMIVEIIEWNTGGGSVDVMVEETSNGSYSGGFNYFVSIFGAFFGPFPSLFPKLTGPTSLEYLGAGLVYKLFLVFPFWYGTYVAIKKKILDLVPLLIFVLLELLLTGAVCASLELRKVILHVPFMYLLTYYGLYHGASPHQLTKITALPSYLFAIGVLFLWNVIKVNN